MVEINSLNIKQEKQKFKTPFGVILCLEAKRWHSETVIETPFSLQFFFCYQEPTFSEYRSFNL